ncbi:RNA polymerase recycling motor ATPase HelR [Microbacterium sp. Root180]|uniref:RNA polymerase recycling motor ATPase HelR n=1 Tax=Microbacterium sp. Root180 TaxID=1736483 RepID=UPI0006F2F0DC|nr:RNA polymerase recycling motor ATPase HelR [Microbacterium sp. Root180]KRB37304.1 AAA family ATPase [Microbacterium sp. Root180]
MNTVATDVFDLPERLSAKARPALIGADERHFAAIERSLRESIADASARLDDVRRRPLGGGQDALDRDLEVHQLTARLRALRRFGLDICLGHIVEDEGGEPVYIGRLGLTDRDGRRLLIDWRSPAAAPFFGATHGDPMGLARRRRYRWTAGRITDYWDEVFTAEGFEDQAALDDQSAFIASLGASRSPRMRDVLATIQADQDAIIRAGSRGALVVDGGPGTGKTVVALHRAAYLLYSDPRLRRGRGGVLVVGPHRPYLAYVSDVLPGLGEDGVELCTLGDLVPEGAAASVEADPAVAALKATAAMVDAVETAVAHHERAPRASMVIETPWADAVLDPADWVEAFAAPEPGTAHNDAREEVRDAVLAIISDQHDEDVPRHLLRRALLQHDELMHAIARAWPLLDPANVVADLWTVPAYLRRCAPWLGDDEIAALQRADGHAWTDADLPLLDAARRRIGDPGAAARRRRREAEQAAEREVRDRVRDDLIAADDSEMAVMSMLRGQDAQNSLAADDDAVRPDRLAGPFAHIVVDEAQELTDAQWRMLLSRCPSRSFTVVGDRAQARHGFAESWTERLERAGLSRIEVASLTVNYRTPAEVMAVAEPVIRAALPDANVPESIRSTGVPVRPDAASARDGILAHWLERHPEGIACVIGDETFRDVPRVRSLTPLTAKGLEFDLVVVVGAERFGPGIEGAVDRYVSMTRATQELVLLT